MGNKYTPAQKKATIKYQKEQQDSISFRTAKGTKDRWKAAADDRGVPLQRFIIEAVEAAIRGGEE